MKKPIRILSLNMDILAEIDSYQSMFFNRSWHGIGAIELRVNRYKKYADTLLKNNLILIGNDLNKVFMIKHREIELDENGKITENWLIKGYALKSIVAQRITMPPAHTSHDNKSGSAETVMKHYINANLVNPVDGKRKIPQLVIAPDLQRGAQINHASRFKNLAEEMSTLSLTSGLGWDVTLDITNKQWVFDVIQGRNLVASQSVLPPVIFSPQFDSLKSLHYTQSELNYKNVAIVAGQGEGVDRRVIEVGNHSAINRHEVFIDARDVAETDDNEQPIPPQQIIQALTDRGQQQLNELIQEEYLEGQILMGVKTEKIPIKSSGIFDDAALDDNGMYMKFNGDSSVAYSEKKVPSIAIENNYTVEIEFMYHDSGNYTLFSAGAGASNRHGCQIEGDVLKYAYYSPSTGYVRVSIDLSQYKNTWLSVKCVNTNGALSMYVNGVKATGRLRPYLYPPQGNFVLGSNRIDRHERENRLVGRIKSAKVLDDETNNVVLDWKVTENGIVDVSGNNNNCIMTDIELLHDYQPSKIINLEPINLTKLGRYQSSVFNYDIDTPEGTSVLVEYSFGNENWNTLTQGDSLPFNEGDWLTDKTLYLRQLLYTDNQFNTPTISNFNYEIVGYTTKDIVTTETFTYESDYDLGDITTVQNLDWGVTMDARITDIKEIYETNGFAIEATFGNNRPTLIQKIKQELNQISGEIRK